MLHIINKNTLFVENKQHNYTPKSLSTKENFNHSNISPCFKTFFNSQALDSQTITQSTFIFNYFLTLKSAKLKNNVLSLHIN